MKLTKIIEGLMDVEDPAKTGVVTPEIESPLAQKMDKDREIIQAHKKTGDPESSSKELLALGSEIKEIEGFFNSGIDKHSLDDNIRAKVTSLEDRINLIKSDNKIKQEWLTFINGVKGQLDTLGKMKSLQTSQDIADYSKGK
jgi:hypothetical protein